MEENTKSRALFILATGMLILAGSFLFSAKTNEILFSYLPNTNDWLIVGISIPYALIVVAITILVIQIKKVIK